MVLRLFDDFSDRDMFFMCATWAAHQHGTFRHLSNVQRNLKEKKKKKKKKKK
eukprot:NODE_10189_length_1370_cov_9.283186.p8 GENE.NODE_10189_length_1370_cov_9.283186~~NODE_10189_length_1370_cov_9.283186.p8  ORF type:complete len:52 (+),score=28.02 NODE_10189_length_1370_cov_9.283186:1076-1231(+)